MAIDTYQTVRDLVRGNPCAVGVLESFGIDYCCGGAKSLNDACDRAGLPLDKVVAQLEEALKLPPIEEDCHWLTCPLPQVIDHIVQRHHEYSRRQMPLLLGLATKVNLRHGENRPEFAKLVQLLDALTCELTGHFAKEENVLFPAFRRMHDVQSAEALLSPIRHMMEEHDDAGELLRGIRAVTNNFEPPATGCTTLQVLYAGLKEHEADLHRHIHLENNILFPRALEMARSRSHKVA